MPIIARNATMTARS